MILGGLAAAESSSASIAAVVVAIVAAVIAAGSLGVSYFAFRRSRPVVEWHLEDASERHTYQLVHTGHADAHDVVIAAEAVRSDGGPDPDGQVRIDGQLVYSLLQPGARATISVPAGWGVLVRIVVTYAESKNDRRLTWRSSLPGRF